MGKFLVVLIFGCLAISVGVAQNLPRRGTIGVGLAPVPAEAARKDNLPAGQGAIVQLVVPGFSGEAAGLKTGDILVKVNGQTVTAANVVSLIRAIHPGTLLVFSIVRDGKAMVLRSPLTERPRDPGNGNFSVEYGSVNTKAGLMRTIISEPRAPGKHPGLLFIQGYSPISYDFSLTEDTKGLDGPILYAFANGGYETMRVEKPGVGDSEGGPFENVDFTTELDIYRQALKQLKARADVDPNEVFIFGHSMGGAFGPIVASENPVKGMIMYGIAARTWREYMLDITRYQGLLAGESYEQVDDDVRNFSRISQYIFHEGKAPQQVEKEHPELAATVKANFPDGMFTGKCAAFWGQLEDTNFAHYWARSNCHVLAVWGESDFVTYKIDHQLVADIVNKVHPGWGEVATIPSSDHLFNNWSSQEESFKNFGSGNFNPACIKVFMDWADSMRKT